MTMTHTRSWYVGLLTVALTLGLVTSAHAADEITWQSPECERDGSPYAGTDKCTPPGDQIEDDPPKTPENCKGARYCDVTIEDHERAGREKAADRLREAAQRVEAESDAWARQQRQADSTTTQTSGATTSQTSGATTSQTSGATTMSSCGSAVCRFGWVSSYLYDAPNQCSGTVEDGNHCGWLYFRYKQYWHGEVTGPYETAYPARSGNDEPPDRWQRNLGPVPDDKTNGPSPIEFDWGYMNGKHTGYESDSDNSFYPGKWRFDPWVVYKPAGVSGDPSRSAFEIHGGRYGHEFWSSPTLGCIRLEVASINSLKSKWDNSTDNKYDDAPAYIHY